MAEERVELSPEDRERMKDLSGRALDLLQQMAAIQAAALGERHPEFADRTRGKSITAFRLGTKRSAPVEGGVGHQVAVDEGGVFCNDWGSGPGMRECYDFDLGYCWTE